MILCMKAPGNPAAVVLTAAAAWPTKLHCRRPAKRPSDAELASPMDIEPAVAYASIARNELEQVHRPPPSHARSITIPLPFL